MIPGMAPAMTDQQGVSMDKGFGKFEAIIQSMTVEERHHPDILNASRRRRIAMGAGVQVHDVSDLVKKCESLKKLSKKFLGQNQKNSRLLKSLSI